MRLIFPSLHMQTKIASPWHWHLFTIQLEMPYTTFALIAIVSIPT